MDVETPLKRAISAVGTQQKLADQLGIRSASITEWKARRVPPGQCPAIEARTGVRCEDLRPDLRWDRDADGRVIAYAVPLAPIETGKAEVMGERASISDIQKSGSESGAQQ